jgi:hypothetical protein
MVDWDIYLDTLKQEDVSRSIVYIGSPKQLTSEMRDKLFDVAKHVSAKPTIAVVTPSPIAAKFASALAVMKSHLVDMAVYHCGQVEQALQHVRLTQSERLTVCPVLDGYSAEMGLGRVFQRPQIGLAT